MIALTVGLVSTTVIIWRMQEWSVPSKVASHICHIIEKPYCCSNYLQNNFFTQNALQEKCDWLMVYLMVMVVWNCATEECGVQFVITLGTTMMRLWCADSWDTVQRVIGSLHVF